MDQRNTSGLHPKGLAVLVLPYEPQKKESIIALPDTVSDREKMIETRAIVIEIGPSAWDDEKEPRAKVGDHVLIAKFSGVMAVGIHDKKKYRIVNDRDIFCGIDEEE